MPYASQRDRNPHQLELRDTPWPAAPLNLFLTSGYTPGVFNLCWADPAQLALNSRFTLLGVNVYRSFDSEYGPYDRITDLPVGANFWRDQTDNVLVMGETVEEDQWLMRGHPTAELNRERWVFRTQRRPIVRPDSQAIPADVNDVVVRIDGQLARVLRVHGETGEIELDPSVYADVTKQNYHPVTRPETGSVVTVSYRWNRSLLRTDLFQRVFYRVTTVAMPVGTNPNCGPAELLETPLERAAFTSNREIEKLDWTWKEAVRRNRWILNQGGERVKAFLRKHVGTACSCYVADHLKHPVNDCPKCYGTGFVGGFEGPYDIIIAPDETERRVEHTSSGKHGQHVSSVWTGPSPLLSQRDFIVKVNGDRYSIGPVSMPSNRGMVLQQHFDIGYFDEKDIRGRVPVQELPLSPDRVPPVNPPGNPPASVTDHTLIPDERELRGRTVTWSNIVY